MNAKIFRSLVLFCCTAAAGFIAAGVYAYVSKARWVEQINTPANVASVGPVQFTPPVITSNALCVAGLFLALAGCFSIKVSQATLAAAQSRQRVDEEPPVGG